MTPENLVKALDVLDCRVVQVDGQPIIRFPVGTSADVIEQLLPDVRLHREHVLAHFDRKANPPPDEGRVCAECHADVFVTEPHQVALVCQRLTCPSYNPLYWPPWAEDWHRMDRWKKERDAKAQRSRDEPIPD